ncbi:histone-lysine N-methyltransferase SETMAR-like [Polistes fuscatus]|uniref:histone-lysine N-methyltransferase SETMAR-like n=1 Tax=Polistes fuscatus TaxID=30207 RepID=UPI001CA99E3B|nr:histone-lysine N-methyltransferase SETMAR-like [Polistes fuscatus]
MGITRYFPGGRVSGCFERCSLLLSCRSNNNKELGGARSETVANIFNDCICSGVDEKIAKYLKRLIASDKKLIIYDKNLRKRSWSKQGEAPQTMAKLGLTARKVMPCVWWDWKGNVCYELLAPGQAIDSDLYCQQLKRLQQESKKKRSEFINRKSVVFYYDNARQHASLMIWQELRELGWEFFQNSLNGVKLTLKEACENHLLQFFRKISQESYSKAIDILSEKWKKVVDQNDTYLIE